MKSVIKNLFLGTIFCVSYTVLNADISFNATKPSSPTLNPISSAIMRHVNLNSYLAEVSLTESGLTSFFKCYNNPFYARRFLPSCFLHVTDFLQFLPHQTDPWAYATTIFSMFLTKLKGCSWTNAFALADLVEALPGYLEPLTYVEQFKQNLKKEIRQRLVRFAVKDPSECVDGLVSDFDRYHDTLNKVTEFQFETTRFLDAAFDKLIWDPADKGVIWDSFKRLGSALEIMVNKRIMSPENGNEVVWSLLHSFAKFIDMCGATLSLQWYADAINNLPKLSFLSNEEVDPLMQTKLDYLSKALNLGYAQAVMYQKNVSVPQ